MVVSPVANKEAFQVSTPSNNEIVMTRLTAICAHPSKDVRDMVIGTGMEKGAAISYDHLEDFATELQQS